MRGEGDGHHDGDTELIESRRHGLEQARGRREGVGGADAREDRGQPQPVINRREQGFGGDRPTESHAREEVRQHHRRQREEHGRTEGRGNDDLEHHADGDDDQADAQEDREGP